MDFSRAYSISRALSNAWKLLFAAPIALLVGGALLMLLDGNYGFSFDGDHWRISVNNRDFDAWFAPLASMLVAFGCLLGLFFFIASSWLLVGYSNAVEETARTGEDRIAAIFDAKNRWLSMALARLVRLVLLGLLLVPIVPIILFGVLLHEGLELPEELAAAAAVVGVLLYLPFWIYAALGLALIVPAVALDGLDPFAAVSRSWSLVRGNRTWLFLYGFVMIVVELSGLLVCCIGMFFTATLARIAWTDSYLALTRGDEYLNGFLAEAAPAATDPAPSEEMPEASEAQSEPQSEAGDVPPLPPEA
jgi:hypothetical protein